jgi:hypothetical protein
MDTRIVYPCLSLHCHAREGGHPVIRVTAINAEAVLSSGPVITGSSAFADDDNGRDAGAHALSQAEQLRA